MSSMPDVFSRYDSFSLVFRSQPFCDSGEMNGVTASVFTDGTLLIPGCLTRRMVRIDPIDSKYLRSVYVFWFEHVALLGRVVPCAVSLCLYAVSSDRFDDLFGVEVDDSISVDLDRFVGDSSSVSSVVFAVRFRLFFASHFPGELALCAPSLKRRRLYVFVFAGVGSSSDKVLRKCLPRVNGGGSSDFTIKFELGGLSNSSDAQAAGDERTSTFSIGVSRLEKKNNEIDEGAIVKKKRQTLELTIAYGPA